MNDYTINNTIDSVINTNIKKLTDVDGYEISIVDTVRYNEYENIFILKVIEFKSEDKTFIRYNCFAFNGTKLMYHTDNAPYSQDFNYNYIIDCFIKDYKKLITNIYHSIC